MAIHTDEVGFSDFHLHGHGDVTLAMSERGLITEVWEHAGLINESGGMTALLTDGVYHRPRASSGRLIAFASLRAAENGTASQGAW